MKRLDRALCVSAGIFGLATFIVSVTSGQRLELAVGILALFVGLITASFATWRIR